MKAKQSAVKILLLVVVGLLICTVALAAYTPKSAQIGQIEDAVYEITNIPVTEIKAVAISNAKSTYGLLQSGGDIMVMSENAQDNSYSMTELRTLIYAACHLTGSREITDLSSAEQYGINNPLARVTLMRSDGGESKFSILSQNPMDDTYFLFSEDKQAIYLIPQASAQLFLREEKDFISRTIFPVITADNYRNVSELSLEFNGNGRDYTLINRNGSFYLSSPIEQKVSAVLVMEHLLRNISALYGENLITSDGNFSDYELDDYTLKISMTYDGVHYNALLRRQNNGSMLLADPADGRVYSLSNDLLPALTQDYLVLTGGTAYNYGAGDLREVSVFDARQEALFALSGEGEQLVAKVNGKTMESAAVSELFKSLNGCGIEKEVDFALTGNADLTILYTLSSGRIDRVELIPAEGGSYYVAVNGVVNFTTTASAVEEIRTSAFAYLA